MCIRDRINLDHLRREELVGRLVQQAINQTPVSYTHLDVYKRQVQGQVRPSSVDSDTASELRSSIVSL